MISSDAVAYFFRKILCLLTLTVFRANSMRSLIYVCIYVNNTNDYIEFGVFRSSDLIELTLYTYMCIYMYIYSELKLVEFTISNILTLAETNVIS